MANKETLEDKLKAIENEFSGSPCRYIRQEIESNIMEDKISCVYRSIASNDGIEYEIFKSSITISKSASSENLINRLRKKVDPQIEALKSYAEAEEFEYFIRIIKKYKNHSPISKGTITQEDLKCAVLYLLFEDVLRSNIKNIINSRSVIYKCGKMQRYITITDNKINLSCYLVFRGPRDVQKYIKIIMDAPSNAFTPEVREYISRRVSRKIINNIDSIIDIDHENGVEYKPALESNDVDPIDVPGYYEYSNSFLFSRSEDKSDDIENKIKYILINMIARDDDLKDIHIKLNLKRYDSYFKVWVDFVNYSSQYSFDKYFESYAYGSYKLDIGSIIADIKKLFAQAESGHMTMDSIHDEINANIKAVHRLLDKTNKLTTQLIERSIH